MNKEEGGCMLALQGYYDVKSVQSARGVLKNYANPSMQSQERGAWKKAVIDRYGNA
mgnify:CR=1 FL=1